MLQIRAQQLAILREARIRDFEMRLVDHVLAQYPEEATNLQTPEAVLALIRRTISHGQSLGFSKERDLAALVDLTVVYGERFEDTLGEPEILDILQDREISPRTRIELVLELMPE